MGMELLIAIIVVAVIAIMWAIRKDMAIGDVNKDGKVDVEDAKALANEVREWANEATAEIKQKAEEVVAKAAPKKKPATKKAAVKKKTTTKKAASKKKATTAKK